MRIISGDLKGRQFKGAVPKGVRPTSDSVRESIFNILNNFIDFDNKLIMDICAGTGAMGFESISRGASKVVFIDKSANVCTYIKKTIADFKISPTKYEIINSDAVKALTRIAKEQVGATFDIIISDPPYNLDILNEMLSIIAKANMLSQDGIIAIEMASNSGVLIPDTLEIVHSKIYGDTKVVLIQYID